MLFTKIRFTTSQFSPNPTLRCSQFLSPLPPSPPSTLNLPNLSPENSLFRRNPSNSVALPPFPPLHRRKLPHLHSTRCWKSRSPPQTRKSKRRIGDLLGLATLTLLPEKRDNPPTSLSEFTPLIQFFRTPKNEPIMIGRCLRLSDHQLGSSLDYRLLRRRLSVEFLGEIGRRINAGKCC